MDVQASAHARERALPTGTLELVINLRHEPLQMFAGEADERGTTHAGGVVIGAQNRYFVLDTSQASAVIGVHFRPGGAGPFLGVPAAEFTNQAVDLEAVWGREARALRQRLLETRYPGARLELLEHALTRRFQESLQPNAMVRETLMWLDANPVVSRVDPLRRETGYSPKRFIDLFRQSVGLAPKSYCRIQRFQAVIARLAAAGRVEWAGVAADAGLFDQSHLNREFRAFAGLTPAQYRPVSPDRPSHVAVGE